MGVMDKLKTEDQLFEYALKINDLLKVTSGQVGISFEKENFQEWLTKIQSIQGWLDIECLGSTPAVLTNTSTFCEWRVELNKYIDGYAHCAHSITNPPPDHPKLRVQGTTDGYSGYISPADIVGVQVIEPPKITNPTYFSILGTWSKSHRFLIDSYDPQYPNDPYAYIYGYGTGMCIEIDIGTEATGGPRHSSDFNDVRYPIAISYCAGDICSFGPHARKSDEGEPCVVISEKLVGDPEDNASRIIELCTNPITWVLYDSKNILRAGDGTEVPAITGGYCCVFLNRDLTPAGSAIDHSLLDGVPYMVSQTGEQSWGACRISIGGTSAWHCETGGGSVISSDGVQEVWDSLGCEMTTGCAPMSNFMISGIGHWPIEEGSGESISDLSPYDRCGQLVPIGVPAPVDNAISLSSVLNTNPEAYWGRNPLTHLDKWGNVEEDAWEEEGFNSTIINTTALRGGSSGTGVSGCAMKKLPVITPLYWKVKSTCVLSGTATFPVSLVEGSRVPGSIPDTNGNTAAYLSAVIEISRVIEEGSVVSISGGNRAITFTLERRVDAASMGSMNLFINLTWNVGGQSGSKQSGPYVLPYTNSTRVEVRTSPAVDYQESADGTLNIVEGMLVTIGGRIIDLNEFSQSEAVFLTGGAMPNLVIGEAETAVSVLDIVAGNGRITSMEEGDVSNPIQYEVTEYVYTRFRGTKDAGMTSDDGDNELDVVGPGSHPAECWVATFPEGDTGSATFGTLAWGPYRLGIPHYTGLMFPSSNPQSFWNMATKWADAGTRYLSDLKQENFTGNEVEKWISTHAENCVVSDILFYAVGTTIDTPAIKAWANDDSNCTR